MKKIFLLLTAIVLFSTSFFASIQQAKAASPFPDMLESGRTEITRLINEKIILGYEDGTFRPNKNVTRAEAVSMIVRALKLNDEKRPTNFPDVPNNHYASGAITTATERGIITGYPDGTFQPDKSITRAEMAAILSRAFSFPDTNLRFFYDVKVTTFGVLEINKLAASGVTVGYGDGTFRPTQAITRHEFSLLLARTLYPEFRVNVPPTISGNIVRAKVVNVSSSLLVRDKPSQDGAVIGQLENGTEIEYYAKIGEWAAFFYNGKTSYVSTAYLEPYGVLQGKVIVVDPGHGGSDPGAVNKRLGYYEKNIVLSVGQKLKQKLEQAGATVVMTRNDDTFVSLSDRSALANRSRADAFISIHVNAASSTAAHGTETYWNRTHASADSKRLADYIQKQLIAHLKTYNRGVKEANFHVIRESKMASVLVELGFISNDEEAKKLVSDSFQNQAAEAIYSGIVQYFANKQ